MYNIFVCQHREQSFIGTFSKNLEHKRETYECSCEVYDNHENLAIFYKWCAVFECPETVFDHSCYGSLPTRDICN